MTTEQKNEFKPIIDGFVKGIPFTKTNATKSVKKWEQSVKQQTAEYKGEVKGPCHLEVIFYLPKSISAHNAGFGPDLDNLAKPFLDGLKETALNVAVSGCDGDACIVFLQLSKVNVNSEQEAGARFRVSVQGHKIEKVEIIAMPKLDLGVKHWKNPMQKITTKTGVYVDNLPGVSHNSSFPPGYDWKQEVGKVVYGAEVNKSRGHLWLNKKKP